MWSGIYRQEQTKISPISCSDSDIYSKISGQRSQFSLVDKSISSKISYSLLVTNFRAIFATKVFGEVPTKKILRVTVFCLRIISCPHFIVCVNPRVKRVNIYKKFKFFWTFKSSVLDN
ncbi:MAG: hypothetical protein F6K24_26945 [Okeania sp. SIO2D1]|nr:hypothetical protein [Okeania sp. SIO2D1]